MTEDYTIYMSKERQEELTSAFLEARGHGKSDLLFKNITENLIKDFASLRKQGESLFSFQYRRAQWVKQNLKDTIEAAEIRNMAGDNVKILLSKEAIDRYDEMVQGSNTKEQ